MERITYRPARVDDYKSIARVHTRSWQENYRGSFSDHFLDREALTDRMSVWEERLSHPAPNQLLWVALQKETLCGFACAFIDEDAHYGTLLDNLHVSSTAIGKGIGPQLISRIVMDIKASVASSTMYLWVLEHNLDALRFYKRLGGVVVETVTGHDIGDREVRKTRVVWDSLVALEVREMK